MGYQNLDPTELFVTCAQGLEALLMEELQELGYEHTHPGFRGVFVKISALSDVYRINYNSRIASRVLFPIAIFKCYDQKALYRGASQFDWTSFFRRGKTFAIDSNVNHRLIRNSLFAAQVVKDAICDQLREKLGERPNVDVKNPDIQLNLFIQGNVATLSLDTSGVPLHKRGYRLDSVEAPMQENLAAAILRLAKYRKEDILCDPCCGSGTLLIEAALIASQIPPGFLRKEWGFMRFPEFSASDWLKVKMEADQKRQPLAKGHFWGREINKNALRVCKTNMRAAGFLSEIDISQGDFREWTPPILPNLLITNPPHGKRLDSAEVLRPLYRSIGDFMKQKMAKPARGFVFTGNLELTKEVGLAPKRRHVLHSGGVESRLLEFDVY
ncbi:THUMP domain-containing protein [Parachlamydia sp. AcF125]|uniref:THUMP domain-containing class I SAM-dependent RNA methyltransferase n=1 Tax=Parachlamydia sp. AcF125 TaxID=2795736 RepID=UPI001BCA5098|nr:THUMP domain-containing protein [Parachlamydia sp. AcF125]MBS4169076.1 Ribosomal RNA large subunit methyltransferase L [Parachlamydia sp. AcF125]